MSDIVARIHETASSCPGKIAFRFLDRHLRSKAEITYGEFSAKIISLSQRLEAIPPGSTVAIISDLHTDFLVTFFASMSAKLIPVVFHSPRHYAWKTTRNRLFPLIKSSGAVVIFTDADLDFIKSNPLIDSLSWNPDLHNITGSPMQLGLYNLEHLQELRTFHAREPVAFLQYTSGSVSDPKGVVITNANLIHNLRNICSRTNQSSDCEMFTWLPHSHDMGLVGGLMVPIFSGGTCTILSQLDFLRNPLNWWRGMTKWRSTITAAPCFAYDLSIKKYKSELARDIDLSSVDTAFLGAERITIRLLNELRTLIRDIQLSPTAIYPSYGLAECTLMCSGPTVRTGIPRVTSVNGKQTVSCGSPLNGLDVEIDDDEIVISGESVSRGYWNQPFLNLNNGSIKTGDIGWLLEGELYLQGRTKTSFSINGLKLHPEDFEETIRALAPDLKEKFAATHHYSDERTIAVVLIENEQPESDKSKEMTRMLRSNLSTEHLTPVTVLMVPKGTLIFTTSGKPQRMQIQQIAAAKLTNAL
jgi:acyl-CoA synthetase (AMP-forming)/AMP-acid ligase II